LSGYYGFSNAGDEAVLSSIITGLKAQFGPAADITVFSGSCETTEKLHGVKAVSRSPLGINAAVGDCDLLISGGGSLIQDATSLKSLLYYLGVIWLARDCRVMVLGQGIGPLRRRISKILTRFVLNKVGMIAVRDRESAELLRQIGVTEPPIHVTADPTFILEPCSDEETESLLADSGIKPGEAVIAVSMRSWPGCPQIAEITAEALEKLADNLNARILLVAMQSPDDFVVARKIHQWCPDAAIQSKPWNPRQVRGVLGQCSLVAGMRLHALVLASSAGVPCLGISYDPKVESFMNAANQPCIPLETLTADTLCSGLVDSWNNRDALASRLSETIPDMKKSAMENFRLAAQLLKRPQDER
jgi:polysaccharide pyruvyl transferase CsaB